MSQTIISGQRLKKSVKNIQHKIRQTNHWLILKETIKVKKSNRKDTVELKSDIEKYWISYSTHLSSIIGDSMRKRIDIWILNGKITWYLIINFYRLFNIVNIYFNSFYLLNKK